MFCCAAHELICNWNHRAGSSLNPGVPASIIFPNEARLDCIVIVFSDVMQCFIFRCSVQLDVEPFAHLISVPPGFSAHLSTRHLQYIVVSPSFFDTSTRTPYLSTTDDVLRDFFLITLTVHPGGNFGWVGFLMNDSIADDNVLSMMIEEEERRCTEIEKYRILTIE